MFSGVLPCSFSSFNPYLIYLERVILRVPFIRLRWMRERFSFECRKTKTKVITLTNHNSRKTNQSSKRIHVARAKRGKTHASKSRLVLVLLLIGRGSGARFLNQSQSVAMQNQSNCGITFDTQLKTALSKINELLHLCFIQECVRSRAYVVQKCTVIWGSQWG